MEYKISDTELTATWNPAGIFKDYFECSNCKHPEGSNHPVYGYRLHNFCPQCGFKMTNPKWIHIEIDYD